ncbi:unnamed protein product [Lota lota]
MRRTTSEVKQQTMKRFYPYLFPTFPWRQPRPLPPRIPYLFWPVIPGPLPAPAPPPIPPPNPSPKPTTTTTKTPPKTPAKTPTPGRGDQDP